MHETARDLVSAAYDGELDASGRRALDHHLAGCTECSAYASRLRLLTSHVSELPPVVVPPRLVERTVARLERGRRRTRRRRLVPVVAVAVAAAAAVLAVPGSRTTLTPLGPLAPLPAGAVAAPLVELRSLEVDRTVVETPDGDPARRRSVRERIWWSAPDRLRVERDVVEPGGRVVRELSIRDGDAGYDERGGRPGTAFRGAPPSLASIPEPLSSTVAVLGRPVGPGPVVAGRATTRYELEVAGTRRAALVDSVRLVTLGGEDRLLLGKVQLRDGVVVASRTVTRVEVNPTLDAELFAVPRGAATTTLGFRPGEVGDLGPLAPVAVPRGLDVVVAGRDVRGNRTALFQSGAFPVLVTDAAQPPPDDRAEIAPASVDGRPAVVRIPLHGYPSITFGVGGRDVTVVAPLGPAQLAELASRMYDVEE